MARLSFSLKITCNALAMLWAISSWMAKTSSSSRLYVSEGQHGKRRDQQGCSPRPGCSQENGRFELALAASRPGQSGVAQVPQSQGQVAGRLKSLGRLLFQATQKQAVQLGWAFLTRLTERGRRLVENSGHRVGSRLTVEETAA